MITCETPHRMWTVEGKIEVVHEGAGDVHRTHVGIKDLSHLLAQHRGSWAKVRVELIEGPSAIEAPGSEVVEDLKRMRSMVKEVRERIAKMREARDPHTWGTARVTLEEQCIDTLAETILLACDRIEEFDRRLQSLEGG